jgi:MFS family permease
VIAALRRYARSFTGFERDARIFLLVTLVYGVTLSLWWVDFNLYLKALGFDGAFVGVVGTASAAAGALIAFPASLISDRVGRRLVLVATTGASAVGILGLLLVGSSLAIIACAALVGGASQAFFVVQSPFMAEHSHAEHRSELFSLQGAISTGVNVVAALAGGAIAALAAGIGGFSTGDPAAYRVLLVLMLAAALVATIIMLAVTDDRPRARQRDWRTLEGRPGSPWSGEPVAARLDLPRRSAAVRIGLPRIADRGVFVRLILPGFLISLGAGQVIPYLNVFVQGKFGLDLLSLNAIFALTSLGTTLAILFQPALARRVGKIGSVVLVQATSIPFLAVLGFSPILWTVIGAMAIRNSLMNAGNPIFNAFAMERLQPRERATYAAAASLAWSLGWVIAGPWYSVLQATLGFTAGYAINFVTIIVLYTLGTFLTWRWFHAAGPGPAGIHAHPAPV